MIVVDIDGTLTLSDGTPACLGVGEITKERILEIMDPVRVANIKPRLEIIEKVKNLYYHGEFIAIVTGRWDYLADITYAWLNNHNIPFHGIAMRKADQWNIKSVAIKLMSFQDLLENKTIPQKPLNEILWIDDDQEMIDEVTKLGLRTMKV